MEQQQVNSLWGKDDRHLTHVRGWGCGPFCGQRTIDVTGMRYNLVSYIQAALYCQETYHYLFIHYFTDHLVEHFKHYKCITGEVEC